MSRTNDNVAGEIATFTANVARRNPIKVSLYFFGLLVCLFFKGLTVPDQSLQNYEREMDKLYIQRDSLLDEEDIVAQSYNRYYRSQNFFFSCSTDQCRDNKVVYERMLADLKRKQKASYEQERNAKGNLGVFSVHAVSEMKEMFNRQFAGGKRFAQRSTLWDAVFMGIGSMGRDEALASYVVRIVMRMLMNFTIGVISSLIGFSFTLWSLINTYNAPFYISLAAYFVGVLSAISFCSTWLLGLYVGTIGTGYVVSKVVSANMRLEDGRRGRRNIRQHMD